MIVKNYQHLSITGKSISKNDQRGFAGHEIGYVSDFNTGTTGYSTTETLLKRRYAVLWGFVRSGMSVMNIAFRGFLCVLSETPSWRGIVCVLDSVAGLRGDPERL